MSDTEKNKLAPLKFEDIKEKIQATLQEKLKNTPIQNENGFTLIEGFMTYPLRPEFSNDLILGGPSIPIVGIVGNTSGRIYTYALKAILPDLTI